MQTVRIVLHGVAGSDVQLLRSYLDLIESRGDKQLQIVQCDPQPKLVIIDTDRHSEALPEYHRDTLLVAFTEGPVAPGRFAHHLPKPIRFRDVQELIGDLGSAEATPRAAPRTPASPAPASEPRQRLFHWLQAHRGTRSVEVQLGDQLLLVDVANNMAYASHPLEAMSNLFTADTRTLSIKTPTPAALASASAGMQAFSIEAVKWISAIYGAGGSLPPGFGMSDGLRLRRWPNFKLLYARPSFNRIAGFMSRRYATLEEIAHATDIGVSDIANFACACELCGYLARSASTHVPSDLPSPADSSSIFSRIRNRLGLS